MKQVNSNELRFCNQMRLNSSIYFKELMTYNKEYALIMIEFEQNNFYGVSNIIDKHDNLNLDFISSFKKTGLFVNVNKIEGFIMYDMLRSDEFIFKTANFYELCFALSSIIFVYDYYNKNMHMFRKLVAKGIIYRILYFMDNLYKRNELIDAELNKKQASLN